jgi:hypothetical protein
MLEFVSMQAIISSAISLEVGASAPTKNITNAGVLTTEASAAKAHS